MLKSKKIKKSNTFQCMIITCKKSSRFYLSDSFLKFRYWLEIIVQFSRKGFVRKEGKGKEFIIKPTQPLSSPLLRSHTHSKCTPLKILVSNCYFVITTLLYTYNEFIFSVEDLEESEFVWEDYLKETGATSVPPTAFKHVS